MSRDPTASVDAAVFDYGGVLTTPVRDSIAAWLDRDSIDTDSFSRALKAWLSRPAPDDTPIRRLETGELGTAEFDALLAAELVGKNGKGRRARGSVEVDVRADAT